jgi:poly(3-hydroxybutyrate) depolymerase
VITTVILASTLCVGQVVEKGFADLFAAKEYRFTGGRYHQELFRYRLFVPRLLDTKDRYPLLVWLHGNGESGSDNQMSLRYFWFFLDDPAHLEKYRYFILALQCPKTDPSWYHGCGNVGSEKGQSDEMLTVTAEVLRRTMREYPVDADRVYLAGVCSGAGGCWEMAMRYPEWFAAVVPMAAPMGDLSRVNELVNIPIWAFISSSEQDCGVKETVAALKNVRGNVRLTVTPTPGHDCWSEPMCGGIMDWMLAQRRGAPCWTPPGSRLWQWWHVLTLPAALLVFVRLAWAIEQRRRQRAAIAAAVPRTGMADDDFSFGPFSTESQVEDSDAYGKVVATIRQPSYKGDLA